jgi:hypothetical protein
MRLVPPTGYELYDGATLTAFQSSDGAVFWACCAKDAGGVFGCYVFKQAAGATVSTVVNIGARPTGRGSLTLVDGHNLALVVFDGKPPSVNLYPVPGFTAPSSSPTAAIPAGMVLVPLPLLQQLASYIK